MIYLFVCFDVCLFLNAIIIINVHGLFGQMVIYAFLLTYLFLGLFACVIIDLYVCIFSVVHAVFVLFSILYQICFIYCLFVCLFVLIFKNLNNRKERIILKTHPTCTIYFSLN